MREIRGKIVGSRKNGYRVRVQRDDEFTGGFYIFFENPNSPDDGGDYWVESFVDLEIAFSELGWEVAFEAPLSELNL